MNLWVVIASTIIALLAGYAAYLHWLLWHQRRGRRPSGAATPAPGSGAVHTVEPASVSQQGTVMAEKAVYLLAEALLDNKLTLTEGCMRISAMAAGLTDYERFQKEYAVVFTVAEATAHLPILDAWRALSRSEKKALERERLAIEERHRAAVIAAAGQLKQTRGQIGVALSGS